MYLRYRHGILSNAEVYHPALASLFLILVGLLCRLGSRILPCTFRENVVCSPLTVINVSVILVFRRLAIYVHIQLLCILCHAVNISSMPWSSQKYPLQRLEDRLLKYGNPRFSEIILPLSCSLTTHKVRPYFRWFFRERSDFPQISACPIQHWSWFALQWFLSCGNTLHISWYWFPEVKNCLE